MWDYSTVLFALYTVPDTAAWFPTIIFITKVVTWFANMGLYRTEISLRISHIEQPQMRYTPTTHPLPPTKHAITARYWLRRWCYNGNFFFFIHFERKFFFPDEDIRSDKDLNIPRWARIRGISSVLSKQGITENEFDVFNVNRNFGRIMFNFVITKSDSRICRPTELKSEELKWSEWKDQFVAYISL